ncbi:MAG: hypothetical protein V3T05_03755 [Myxococcota bacterium]
MRRMASAVVIGWVLLVAHPVQAQDLYPQETESYLINYMVLSKSTITAWALSAGPGFGAGHFWCNQTATGSIMAIGQVVGILLYAVAILADITGDAFTAMSLSGMVIFTGFRIADLVFAPGSAETYNRELAKKLKIRPLALRAPDANPARRGQLAFGVALEVAIGQ